MFSFLEKAKILRLLVDIVCELFDKCVAHVLMYGPEVLDCQGLRDVEIFHWNFLRMLLGTFKFIPNCMLYGETGFTDMKTKIHPRMINFWAKLKFGTTKTFPPSCAISCQHCKKVILTNAISNGSNLSKMFSTTPDFVYVWGVESLDTIKFKSIFNQRHNAIFLQNWHDMTRNSHCPVYEISNTAIN